MTRITDEKLAERVRAATGPSDLLDAEIYATIDGAPHTTTAGLRIIPLVLKGDPADWPAYTASVDAALALVERALPGWFVAKIDAWHNANEEVVGHGVTLQKLGPVSDAGYVAAKDGGIGATRPLAILTALLTALSHEEPTS